MLSFVRSNAERGKWDPIVGLWSVSLTWLVSALNSSDNRRHSQSYSRRRDFRSHHQRRTSKPPPRSQRTPVCPTPESRVCGQAPFQFCQPLRPDRGSAKEMGLGRLPSFRIGHPLPIPVHLETLHARERPSRERRSCGSPPALALRLASGCPRWELGPARHLWQEYLGGMGKGKRHTMDFCRPRCLKSCW
jgi:hypothetical protein